MASKQSYELVDLFKRLSGAIAVDPNKKREPLGALSPLFRYGENSGDLAHAEAHFRTFSHYQVF